jgi:hypothetical protein
LDFTPNCWVTHSFLKINKNSSIIQNLSKILKLRSIFLKSYGTKSILKMMKQK